MGRDKYVVLIEEKDKNFVLGMNKIKMREIDTGLGNGAAA
jgi:hypothetical protein